MFGWFRLVGLRLKTISVVELDYGFKLDIAGGAHTTLFNLATRKVCEAGGNEYDAASKFLASHAMQLTKSGTDESEIVRVMAKGTIKLLPKFKWPAIAEHDLEQLMSARKS